MQKKIIITTGDGSPSIYISELNETYHSKHGAVTESDYVYINKGLAYWLDQNNQKKLKVFEMGMGTGLNVYLSYVFSINHKISCEYFSIEKYPLPLKEIQSLNMQVSLPVRRAPSFF